MHEVDAEDDSDQDVFIDDGEDCVALVQHEIEGVADFGVGSCNGGFFGGEEVGGFVCDCGDLAGFEGGAGEVAFGDDVGGILVLVDDDQGRKLVDVHFVHGVANGAFVVEGGDMSVEDFPEDHRGEFSLFFVCESGAETRLDVAV